MLPSPAGALAELEETLKAKQAEAAKAERMLSDTVGPEEIAQVVAKWTGVPVSKLQETDKERLSHLEVSRPSCSGWAIWSTVVCTGVL